MMRIWLDADACPRPVKDVLFRVAEKRKIPLTLVANAHMTTPASPLIDLVRVKSGLNIADDHIADHARPGDLVVTADIPLAARVITTGCEVITPRGESLTPDNIQSILAVRNLKEELRSAQMITGGPPPFGPKDVRDFTNLLDRRLTALLAG